MLRNLALLKLKHVKNTTALDSSMLDCHFGLGELYGKAAISSQKERFHLNSNKWSKNAKIWNLAFILIFLVIFFIQTGHLLS